MEKAKADFKLTDAEIIEALSSEVMKARYALNDLLVAVRGGGDLTPACDIAQKFLDTDTQPPAMDYPNFASDEAGELAFKLNAEGLLSTKAISKIEGSGAEGAITVGDIEAAAEKEAEDAGEIEIDEEDEIE